MLALGEIERPAPGGGDVLIQVRAAGVDPTVWHQSLRGLIAKKRSEDLEALEELIEAGTVTPVLDRAYSPSDAPEAIRYLAEGHARGKVAITV